MNNDVTYHDKWNTPENDAYWKRLNKIIEQTSCSSHIPVAWAREVLELMEYIKSKYGIRRETYATGGWTHPESFIGIVVLRTLTRTFGNLKLKFSKEPADGGIWWQKQVRERSTLSLIKEVPGDFCEYLIDSCKMYARVVNIKTCNFIFRPKVTISQVKEKFGTLRVYFNADDSLIEKDIDEQIRLTEIKLAQKGAYLTLEQLASSYSMSYNEYIFSTTKQDSTGKTFNCVKHFHYAELMHDRLGITIKVDPTK